MFAGANGKVQAVETQAVTTLDTHIFKNEERRIDHRDGIPRVAPPGKT
jgi:hypothetical protein